jgi:L-2-hydroxycarboxylate dehydrogenase (NAD+)
VISSRNAKTIAGEEKVLVPGDPERDMQATREKDGIPLLPVVVNDLNELASKFGLPLLA